MKGSMIFLIVFVVLLLMILMVVWYLVKKAERISRSLFGVKSLAKGLQMQAEELAETPKSISGMTRIYEPQLQKDFPEFNWKEFRDKTEQLLLMSFAAISAGDESRIGGGAENLKQQVITRIRENRRQGIHEQYEQVQIHNTEIARYEKKKGTCILTLQSAVGYIYYKEKGGELIEGSRERMTQTRYNTQLMYIQDAGAANLDKAVGVTCPHCGAPVTGLGVKRCEYCGLLVTPVNIQVWSVQSFYEVDYHRV